MGELKEKCHRRRRSSACQMLVSSSSRTGCEKCRKRRRTRRRSNNNCNTTYWSSTSEYETTFGHHHHHHHLPTTTDLLPPPSSLYQTQLSDISCCSSLLHRQQYYSSTHSCNCHHHSHLDHQRRKHHNHQCVQQHHDLQKTDSSCHQNSHSSHHHHHHLQRNSNLVLSVAFAIVLLFSTNSSPLLVVMANPVSSSVPKWINPCNYDLDSRSSSASSEGVDFQSAEARNLYEQIVSEVENNEAYVNEVKLLFVEETFGDPSFTEEFQWISYDWLPKIPSATQENFATAEVSLKNSFEYLQHFAVAIEQMTMDQMIYEGSHLDQFRSMEKKLRNVLCLLQGAMLKLHVEANPDVTRGVMSEEYRSIDSDAMRNVRDYIIMREHAHALNFIHKAFTHFNNAQDS